MAKYIITAIVETDNGVTTVLEGGNAYDAGDFICSERWGVDDPDSQVAYTVPYYGCTRVE